MATPLDLLDIVKIDLEGEYKYLIIPIIASVESKTFEKIIIRGYRGYHHYEILLKTWDEIKSQFDLTSYKLKILRDDCRGGWISVDTTAREIRIFGTSVDFGKADHSSTVTGVKHLFPNYTFVAK